MSQQSQSQAFDPERGSGSGQGGNPRRISYNFRASLLACYDRLPSPLRRTLKWMSDKFEIESNWGRGLYIAAYIIVILLHPLHYYAYVIKPDKNCLEIDTELYATFDVVIFFNVYMLLYTPNFFKKLFSSYRSSKTKKEFDRSSKTAIESARSKKIAIKHFIVTQIPVLLMTMTVIPDLTTGRDKIFLTTANLFLFGYILLVIGLSFTIKNATEGNPFIAQAKWAKAAYNLFLYLLGGHVFGALWYSFAIHRILACWREEYFIRNKFNPQSLVCSDVLMINTELNCPKINKIPSELEAFGIFKEAIQSRIVELTGQYLQKILYCFRWGLQSLSCFGQNLTPSTDLMENKFVVSIVIYSVVMFVFFIGNMQTYLTSEEVSEKQTLEQFMSFEKLSKKLQKKVIKINNLQLKKLKETKILHIETLFNTLPTELCRDLKIELCLPQLRKVEEFQNWAKPMLMEIYDRIKPTFYVDGTLIVREGDPISEIIFLLNGELWTYTSRATEQCNNEKDHLKDGDFFGKELFTWVQGLQADDSHTSRLPASTKSVKALTNVEAFHLTAYDLKNIFIKQAATSRA